MLQASAVSDLSGLDTSVASLSKIDSKMMMLMLMIVIMMMLMFDV